MFQRFESFYELKKFLPMENFEVMPDNSDCKCKYCGFDLYEVLYKDQSKKYVRCHLCNALWILQRDTFNIAT